MRRVKKVLDMSFDYDTAMSDPDNRLFTNITPREDREETTSMEGWDEEDEYIDVTNDPK